MAAFGTARRFMRRLTSQYISLSIYPKSAINPRTTINPGLLIHP